MNRPHRRFLAATAAALVVCGPMGIGAAAGVAGGGTGLEPTAVSALTRSDWWLLAQSRACVATKCSQTLLSTADGGRSFVARGSLPIPDPAGFDAVDRHELFVSSTSGRLWFSPDAGGSWRGVDPVRPRGGRLFMGMPQVGGGYAYSVAWQGARTRLLRAPLRALATTPARAAWVRLPTPPGAVMGIMVRGHEVLVLSQRRGRGFPRVYASADAGSTFRPTGATLEVVGCGFQPTGGSIWADCTTGMLFGIWRTADGGRNFTPAGSDAYRTQAPDHPVFAGTSGAVFAALSPSAALLGLHPLYRTIDAGASYHRLAGSPRGVDQWIRFDVVDPNFALALGRFTAGGTGASPRFEDRLFEVTHMGTRWSRIRVRS